MEIQFQVQSCHVSPFKHSKYTDFANAVKQSLQAFRKVHDSLSIWHSVCFWEIASSLRFSQNPFSHFKIRLKLRPSGQNITIDQNLPSSLFALCSPLLTQI